MNAQADDNPSVDRQRSRRVCLAVLALALYAGFGVVVLYRAIVDGETLSAAGTLARQGPFTQELRAEAPKNSDLLIDSAQSFIPWLRQAADTFHQEGRLPLWRNSAFCGAPMIGNAQSALLYPPHLVAVFLGLPHWVQAWLVLFKLVLAAFCAYLLARYLAMSVLAALICGAIYGFGGFHVLWMLHPHSAVTAVLPLLFLLTDRVAQRPTARVVALLALTCAYQHLAGHPQLAFQTQVCVFVLGLVRIVSSGSLRAGALRRIASVAAGFVLGAMLSAHVILTFIDYLLESRGLVRREHWASKLPEGASRELLPVLLFVIAAAIAAVALMSIASQRGRRAWPTCILAVAALVGGLLAGAMVPGFQDKFVLLLASDWFGSPWETAAHKISYVELNSAFVGAALPLALFGWLAGRSRSVVRTAGVVLVVGILLALRAPVVSDALGSLPLFRMAGNHRLGLLALLAAGVLAGFGIDALRKPGRLAGRFALIAVSVPAALLVSNALGLWTGLINVLPPTDVARGNLGVHLIDVQFEGEKNAGLICEGFVVSTKPVRFVSVRRSPHNWKATERDVPAAWTVDRKAAQREGAVVTGFRVALPASKYVIEEPLGSSLSSLPSLSSQGVRSLQDQLVMEAVTTDGMRLASDFDADAWDPSAWRRRSMLPVGAKGRIQLTLFALATLAIWFRLWRRSGVLASPSVVAALVAVSLLVFSRGFAPTHSARLFFPSSPLLDFLRDQAPAGRVLFTSSSGICGEIPCYYGVRIVNGIDGLRPLRIWDMLRKAQHDSGGHPLPNAQLLGVMATRYFVNHEQAAVPVPGTTDEPQHRLMGYELRDNPHFLHRARLVSGARVIEEDARALAALVDPAFPVATTVVLAQGADCEASVEPAGTAVISVDAPDRVVVEVQPRTESWLVLADTWFRGWTATVDGMERPIVRANHAFRAVPVSPGERVVEFRYEPASFRYGLVIALVAALIVAGLSFCRPVRDYAMRRDRGRRRA